MNDQRSPEAEHVQASTGREEVIRYFALKVRDSRARQLPPEQRFDKLFEALDIVCRFVPKPREGEVVRQLPNMVRRAELAVQGLSEAWEDRIQASIAPQSLVESLRVINDLILPLLRNEAKTPGYAQQIANEVHTSINHFRENLKKFEKARSNNGKKAASHLLAYCVTLRNCRFHGYYSTSGEIVGLAGLLSPLCDTLEQLLIMMCDHLLEPGGAGIIARINVPCAVARGRGIDDAAMGDVCCVCGGTPHREAREAEARRVRASLAMAELTVRRQRGEQDDRRD